MFRRLNQKVKEKVGRATVTRLSAEVEASIQFTADMKKHLGEMESTVTSAYGFCSGGGLTKLEKFGQRLDKIAAKKKGTKIGTAAAATASIVQDFSKRDRKTRADVLAQFCQGFCKAFITTEYKQCQALIDYMKKRRLDKDAAANSNKPTEEVDANFDAALAECQKAFDLYPEYQQRHAAEVKKLLMIMDKTLQDKIDASSDCKKTLNI
uniref:BAR domain-containing protein n=1 Tax=Panagrolaimus sp. PS1159 TaxID=55785 RepID=A0AC35GAG8_9BILA